MATISSVVSMQSQLRQIAAGGFSAVSATAKADAARRAAEPSYINTITKSGQKDIDTLLAGGDRWWHEEYADGRTPSAGARHALTYSFMADATALNATDAHGFQALNSDQQAKVREALAEFSRVAKLSFTEVASGGNLQYGANVQAASAGYASYPNESTKVMLAANQASFDSDWSRGTYEWQVLLHETGHALGLKHPGSYNAGGGKTEGPYLSQKDDTRNNTLMSYHDASNMRLVSRDGDRITSSTVQADTLQGNDIAALQYLYGAAEGGAARTFEWKEGQTLSQTIWSSNADSRIDLSNQTLANVVDLRAGKRSSIGIRDPYAELGLTKAEFAKLKDAAGRKLTSLVGTPTYTGRDNLLIARNSQINHAVGGSGNDTFITNAARDTVDGGDGNDRFFLTGNSAELTGGDGDDTVFVKKRAGAQWVLSEDHTELSLRTTNKLTKEVSTVSTVSLANIEHVRFWDGAARKATGKALWDAEPEASSLRAIA